MSEKLLSEYIARLTLLLEFLKQNRLVESLAISQPGQLNKMIDEVLEKRPV